MNIPTAPRTMRRVITPPPYRRADSFQLSTRRPDLYRHSVHKPMSEYSQVHRAHLSDTYRPGDAARESTSHRRRASGSNGTGSHLSHEGSGAHRERDVGGLDLQDVRRFDEPREDYRRHSQSGPSRPSATDASGLRRDMDNNGSHVQLELGEGATRQPGVLALPPTSTNLQHPSATDIRDPPRPSPPTAPNPNPSSLSRAHSPSEGRVAGFRLHQPPSNLPTIHGQVRDKDDIPSSMDPSPEKLTVRNISTLSRHSNEDRSSTPSSATSRGNVLCRACAAPGNQVTPLIPCSVCSRGYHDGCGNPKPRQSPTRDEFVCGKCLKQQRSHNSMNTGESSVSLLHTPALSNDALSLAETIFVPQATGVTNLSNQGGLPVNDMQVNGMQSRRIEEPHPGGSAAKDAKNKSASSSHALQGDLYKGITCPFWRTRKCFLFEAHCLFAHKETGEDVGGKAFECSAWRAGLCSKTPSECALSHKPTGRYMDSNKQVVRKHITCYYWKVYGRCSKSESLCPYAHADTGILVWQPKASSIALQGVNSLREYMCPRWERLTPGWCQWTEYSHVCPYSHHVTDKSCFPNLERHPTATPERSVETEESVVFSKSTLQSLSTSDNNHLLNTETPGTAESDRASSAQVTTSNTEYTDIEDETTASRVASRIGAVSALKSTEVGNAQPENSVPRPRIMWAKRGGRRAGPEGGRNKTRPQTPPAAIGQILNSNPPNETNMTTAKNVEPSNLEVQDQEHISFVKRCESCSRQILGTRTMCASCTPDKLGQLSSADPVQSRTTIAETDTADNGLSPNEIQSATATEARSRLTKTRKRTAQDEAIFVPARKRLSFATQTLDNVAKALAMSENLRRASITDSLDPAQVNLLSGMLDAPELLSRLQKQAISPKAVGTNSQLTTNPSSLPGPACESDPGLSDFESEDGCEQGIEDRDLKPDTEGGGFLRYLTLSNFSPDMPVIPSIESELRDVMESQSDADTMNRPQTSTGPPQGDSSADSVIVHDTTSLEDRIGKSLQSGNPGRSILPTTPCLAEDLVEVVPSIDSARIKPGTGLVSDNGPRTVTPANHVSLSKEPLSPGRSCRMCNTLHQRCFHRYDGFEERDLDPQKCWLFLRDYARQQVLRVQPRLWEKIEEAAKSYSPLDESSDLLDGILLGDKSNLSVTEEADGAQCVERGQSGTVEREQRDWDTSAQHGDMVDVLEWDDDNDIPLAQLRPRHPNQPEASILAKELGRKEAAVGGSNDREGKKGNGSMSDADQQRALDLLRENGIMIDSDSDERHSEDGERPSDLPELVTDPLHYRAKSQNLFDLDRSLDIRDPENFWAALGEIPPWQKNKPSKKQLMKDNNLLRWQMWCNQQRYGSPHTETLKLATEVACTTAIVRQVPVDTADPYSTPRTEMVESTMSFSEFVGLPTKPVIEYGRNDDELIIRQGNDDETMEVDGPVRRRRVREVDKFPFVYDILQAKRDG